MNLDQEQYKMVGEFCFFDGQRNGFTSMHVQEIDYDNQESSLSSHPHASTDHYYHKRRKTSNSDSSEDKNRKVMLFGVNINDNDEEEKKKKISKAKGNAKVTNDRLEEKKKMSGRSSNGRRRRARKQQQPNVNEQVVPPPVFHPRIVEEIQDVEAPVLLFAKRLVESDTKKNEKRLFITESEKLMEALTEEERRKVVDEDSVLKVPTSDPNGVKYELHLTKWRSLNMIILKYGWRKLVEANKLDKGDCVRGWGYRMPHDNQLRLAINIIKNGQHAAA